MTVVLLVVVGWFAVSLLAGCALAALSVLARRDRPGPEAGPGVDPVLGHVWRRVPLGLDERAERSRAAHG